MGGGDEWTSHTLELAELGGHLAPRGTDAQVKEA